MTSSHRHCDQYLGLPCQCHVTTDYVSCLHGLCEKELISCFDMRSSRKKVGHLHPRKVQIQLENCPDNNSNV